MTKLVDVVNFNADASCMSAARWLELLEGGTESELCRWLRLYVEFDKPVVLGFVGGTIADIAVFNPEAFDLVRRHRDVFDIIARPFAHDIGLLRTPLGFERNVAAGVETARKEFGAISPYFLPPEFMLTNEQATRLLDLGFEGVFINAARFDNDLKQRIPKVPYWLRGLWGHRIACLPLDGLLASSYLRAIQLWDCASWNRAVMDSQQDVVFAWRDGESSFFLPDGLGRERAWLQGENPGIERAFVGSNVGSLAAPSSGEYLTYPVHSFAPWFEEFRMLGFLRRVELLERRLAELTSEEAVLWMQVIGSDILSAVEKPSPVVKIARRPGSDPLGQEDFCILRSERGFEGEEYLAILEGWGSAPIRRYVETSQSAHILKLNARRRYWAAAQTERAHG